MTSANRGVCVACDGRSRFWTGNLLTFMPMPLDCASHFHFSEFRNVKFSHQNTMNNSFSCENVFARCYNSSGFSSSLQLNAINWKHRFSRSASYSTKKITRKQFSHFFPNHTHTPAVITYRTSEGVFRAWKKKRRLVNARYRIYKLNIYTIYIRKEVLIIFVSVISWTTASLWAAGSRTEYFPNSKRRPIGKRNLKENSDADNLLRIVIHNFINCPPMDPSVGMESALQRVWNYPHV